MTDDFKYDVFLSHSAKDNAIVRAVAERLRKDGLRVWFDEWEIRAGDSIPAKIEEGLEHSRVLVLCMSANAFGSDWAHLESGTFRFRDPLNKERRFIPLRLDDAPIKGSLSQFLYINWPSKGRKKEYAKLREACRPLATLPAEEHTRLKMSYESLKQASSERTGNQNIGSRRNVLTGHEGSVWSVAVTPDGRRIISGSADTTIRLWELSTGTCIGTLKGHTAAVHSVAVSGDGQTVLSGSQDTTVRVWDLQAMKCQATLTGHTLKVSEVAFVPGGKLAVSGGSDYSIRIWDLYSGNCVNKLRVEHSLYPFLQLAVTPDGSKVISSVGILVASIGIWNRETGERLRSLDGHTKEVRSVAILPDGKTIVSGSDDKTVKLWNLVSGKCIATLEGHTETVNGLAISSDGRVIISGSKDATVRTWEVETGRLISTLKGHAGHVNGVAITPDGRCAVSGGADNTVHIWDIPAITIPPVEVVQANRYTNAKVLLVGESGAGKTGLSKRLALNDWQPSDSTVGAWATQWKLPVSSGDGVEREIWLWDFGGQADQRLIHQLYMDETALAVLVFDGQKEDLFETLGQWDRDLTRASRNPFAKLLVAGRVDAGGLRVSRSQVEAFAKERGYTLFLETSAKANLRCEELKQAILGGIRWENIPWRSSPLLFQRLREETIRLKDSGRVLMRFNELRETLQLRLLEERTGEVTRFTDEELRAVVSLLAGPGVVWELKFGSWVLLQPERINAYAQAVIQTMREDEHERGCLPEERVLNGDLTYHSSIERLEADEERFVLLAMHQTLVERGLCLRQHTDRGPLLIFPSYYRRERKELVSAPAVLVSYRFNGFLDDIYATLVVRLHHTGPFEQDQLWRYAADFKTLTGKQLGVKLIRRAEGAGELEVYFDPAIEVGEKIIFSKYVHEHLLQNAEDVVRLRYYVCSHCGTPVGNREVAMKRLYAWLETGGSQTTKSSLFKGRRGKLEKPTILCSECEKRVPLWDDLEEHFASPETKQRVRQLEDQSAIVLDNESKERALVGEVISTAALAGQISREFNVSDHGIDMEIEFKSDEGEATGRKVYLQLKSGDSYLRERKLDGVEVFTFKDERHARYWMTQSFPVLLVIRNSDGEIRWMEVRDWLRRTSEEGRKTVKQIAFEGERFDVMSVRRWRDQVLGQGSASG